MREIHVFIVSFTSEEFRRCEINPLIICVPALQCETRIGLPYPSTFLDKTLIQEFVQYEDPEKVNQLLRIEEAVTEQLAVMLKDRDTEI